MPPWELELDDLRHEMYQEQRQRVSDVAVQNGRYTDEILKQYLRHKKQGRLGDLRRRQLELAKEAPRLVNLRSLLRKEDVGPELIALGVDGLDEEVLMRELNATIDAITSEAAAIADEIKELERDEW